MLSRSSAGQTSRGPIRNQDSSAVEDPARSWPPPRQTAVGDPPPSGRRLGALLSLDDFGSSVEGAAKLHPLWQAGVGGVMPGVRAMDWQRLGRELPDLGKERMRYQGWCIRLWNWCPSCSSVAQLRRGSAAPRHEVTILVPLTLKTEGP